MAKFPAENLDPVLQVSKDGIILYHNRASELLLEHWQYKEGERLQDRWLQFVLDALKDNERKIVETDISDKIISLTFTPIGATGYVNVYGMDITGRKKAEIELKKHRDHLEELVKARTEELEEKNKRLEDFNKLFVGREFRIKELRLKVKELEEKLGI